MDCQDPCFTAKFQLLVQPRSQVFLLIAPEGQVRENPGNNVVTCSTCITSIPGSCFAPLGQEGGGGGSTGVKFPSPPMWSGDERRRIEIASCALMKHCTPLKTTTQTIISKP